MKITVREILSKVEDCTDFNQSHYLASAIIIYLNGEPMNYATTHDNDKRSELAIILGNDASTFKHGHIKTVYCCLPREAVTPDIEKYRDLKDPHMYKFYLPEREFNSILNQFDVDLEHTIEHAWNKYAQYGYEWDGDKNWKKKVQERFKWNIQG